VDRGVVELSARFERDFLVAASQVAQESSDYLVWFLGYFQLHLLGRARANAGPSAGRDGPSAAQRAMEGALDLRVLMLDPRYVERQH
jgi:hypothetical protein